MLATSRERLSPPIVLAFWLALLLLLPMWATPHTAAVFESDKAALARFLALGVLCALAFAGLAGWRPLGRSGPTSALAGLARQPVALAMIGFMAAQGLSMLLALAPATARWGVDLRGGGWWLTLSLALPALALGIVGRSCRETEQTVCPVNPSSSAAATLEGLVRALALGLLPPLVFAWCQTVGFDPLGGLYDEMGGRASGFLGNPIYLGHLLGVSAPWLAWLAFAARRAGRRLEAFFSLMLLLGALLMLALTGSRGPLLATLAVAGLVTLQVLARRPRTARLGALLAFGALLTLLAVGSIGALALAHDAEREGSGPHRLQTVRVRLWMQQALSRAMHQPDAMVTPEGLRDRSMGLRRLLGYGQQGLAPVFDRCYPPRFERAERPGVLLDSAHNATLDAWGETGLLGLLAYGALSVMTLARVWGRRRWKQRALWLALTAAAGGWAFHRLLAGAGGPGLAWGLLVGMVPLAVSVPDPEPGPDELADGADPAPPGARRALWAALTVFALDAQFCQPPVAGWMLFWLGCGLVLAWEPRCRSGGRWWKPELGTQGAEDRVVTVGRFDSAAVASERQNAPNASAQVCGSSDWAWFAWPLLAGLQWLLLSAQTPATTGDAFGGWWGPVGLLRALMALPVIGFGWLWAGGGRPVPSRRRRAVVFGLILLGWALFAAWPLSGGQPTVGLQDATARLTFLIRQHALRAALVVLGFGGLAWVAAGGGWRGANGPARGTRGGRGGVGLFVSVIVVAWLGVALWGLGPVARDRLRDGLARKLADQGLLASAGRLFDGLSPRYPWLDAALMRQARVRAEGALTLASPAARDALMAQAVTLAERGISLAPFNARHRAQLGQTWQHWAQISPDADTQRERALAALAAYDAAIALSPRPAPRVMRARLRLRFLDQPAQAEAELLSVVAQAPRQADALAILAVYYRAAADQAGTADERDAFRERAALFARRALAQPTQRRAIPDTALESIVD